MTPNQQRLIDKVLAQGGDKVDIEEIDRVTDLLFKEIKDEHNPREARHTYVTLLPVLDTRRAVRQFDEARSRMPWWKRLIEGLKV